MRIKKKKLNVTILELGCIPLSTEKHFPAVGTFRTVPRPYGYPPQVKGYFVSLRAKVINKLLGKPSGRVQSRITCPVCKEHYSYGTQRLGFFGEVEVPIIFDDEKIISVKHNGRMHGLFICSKPCRELYELNPLGYNLTKIYGL